jgi:hypothetical protein
MHNLLFITIQIKKLLQNKTFMLFNTTFFFFFFLLTFLHQPLLVCFFCHMNSIVVFTKHHHYLLYLSFFLLGSKKNQLIYKLQHLSSGSRPVSLPPLSSFSRRRILQISSEMGEIYLVIFRMIILLFYNFWTKIPLGGVWQMDWLRYRS